MVKDKTSRPKKKKTISKKKKTEKKITKTDSFIPKLRRLPLETVQKGLEKSGFPLELSVRKFLQDSGWNTLFNQPFMDYTREPPVERTIDIIARREYEPKSEIINTYQLNLIIECKQQNNTAWIFSKDGKRKIDWSKRGDAALYCGDSVMRIDTGGWHSSAFMKLGQCSHQCPEVFETLSTSGSSYIERSKEKKDKFPDLLHKGSSQVINALLHHNNKLENRSKKSSSLFWRNYPVLVFNGSLFYAYLDDKGKMQLEDTNYIHYFQVTTKRWYMIDVVRIDFMKEYLSYINKEFEQVSSFLDDVEYRTI